MRGWRKHKACSHQEPRVLPLNFQPLHLSSKVQRNICASFHELEESIQLTREACGCLHASDINSFFLSADLVSPLSYFSSHHIFTFHSTASLSVLLIDGAIEGRWLSGGLSFVS